MRTTFMHTNITSNIKITTKGLTNTLAYMDQYDRFPSLSFLVGFSIKGLLKITKNHILQNRCPSDRQPNSVTALN